MKLKLFFTLLSVLMVGTSAAQSANSNLPHLIEKDGRHALIVDGEPFLMLGAQSNNSSTWLASLPKVWSAMEKLHANTLEIPIYWEQFEPQEGQYDYSVMDAVIEQARTNNVRLVLLWFATWKNGSNHYMPSWMKLQPKKYPNMIGRNGEPIDSPSPHEQATLEADVRAFSAFMTHLKEVDPQHTVIMVQVENEPGTWDTPRDFSKEAQKLFDNPVPQEAIKAMGLSPKSNKNWTEVFGRDADEFFHVWHVASFIGKVAAAGKAIYPLPLLVNGALRDPIDPGWPPYYQIGGPNDNVFELWKAAAPTVDVLAPDIYFSDSERYLKILELYNRPDNALFVPETIWSNDIPKYFYSALGQGAIGYAPFGTDDTILRLDEDGNELTDEDKYGQTASNYKIFAPMAREIARLNFEGKIKTAVQLEAIDPAADRGVSYDKVNYLTDATLSFNGWDINTAFGYFDRMSRSVLQPEHPDGRIMAAELSENQFLLAGYHCRVMFKPANKNEGKVWQYLKVEEGHYENGVFKMDRLLNGDQTDWGLYFDEPKVIRVTVYTR